MGKGVAHSLQCAPVVLRFAGSLRGMLPMCHRFFTARRKINSVFLSCCRHLQPALTSIFVSRKICEGAFILQNRTFREGEENLQLSIRTVFEIR